MLIIFNFFTIYFIRKRSTIKVQYKRSKHSFSLANKDICDEKVKLNCLRLFII